MSTFGDRINRMIGRMIGRMIDRMIVAVYRRQRRWMGALSLARSPNRGFSEAVWLGIFRARHLQQLTDDGYRRASDLRDSINAGLHSVEIRCEAELPPTARVLLWSAGCGREMLALTKRGHRVIAVEVNPELVSAANQWLRSSDHQNRLECRTPYDLAGFTGPYDCIWIGLAGYSHMHSPLDRLRFLAAAAQRTRAAGLLVVSHFTPDAPEPGRWAGVARAVGQVSRNPRQIESGERLSECYTRYSRPEHVDRELRAAGWRPVRVQWLHQNLRVVVARREPTKRD